MKKLTMIFAIRRFIAERKFVRSADYRAWVANRKELEALMLRTLSRGLPASLGGADDLGKLAAWVSERQSERFVLTRKLSEIDFMFGSSIAENLESLVELHAKATVALQGVVELRRQEVSESGLTKKSMAALATWSIEYELHAAEFNMKRRKLAQRVTHSNAHLPSQNTDWAEARA